MSRRRTPAAVELGRQVPHRRRRLHHRVCASTRARRTPGRTSATSGRASGTLLAEATFTGESRLGLAAGRASPVRCRSTAEHDLRGLLPHASSGATRRTSGYFAGSGRRQRAAPRAADDGQTGRTASTRTARAALPEPVVQRHELLGRRRLRADGGPGHHPADRPVRRRRSNGASGVAHERERSRSRSARACSRRASTGDVRAARRLGTARPGDGHLRPRDPHGDAGPERRRWLQLATYTATRQGRSTGVTDLAGNPLAADTTWSFTTARRRHRRRRGAGRPILVVASARQPVQPLLRRDPARRGPERLHRDRHLARHAEPCCRTTTSSSSARCRSTPAR